MTEVCNSTAADGNYNCTHLAEGGTPAERGIGHQQVNRRTSGKRTVIRRKYAILRKDLNGNGSSGRNRFKLKQQCILSREVQLLDSQVNPAQPLGIKEFILSVAIPADDNRTAAVPRTVKGESTAGSLSRNGPADIHGGSLSKHLAAGIDPEGITSLLKKLRLHLAVHVTDNRLIKSHNTLHRSYKGRGDNRKSD